jgi:hypothetical protein
MQPNLEVEILERKTINKRRSRFKNCIKNHPIFGEATLELPPGSCANLPLFAISLVQKAKIIKCPRSLFKQHLSTSSTVA